MMEYPPFFELPQDLRLVEVIAYSKAMEDAYAMIQEKRECTPAEIEGLARATCAEYKNTVSGSGKRGSTDPDLFRQTWISTYVAQFPRACELLRTGQLVIDPEWTGKERMEIMTQHAWWQLDERKREDV